MTWQFDPVKAARLRQQVDWFPLHCAFGGDVAEYVKRVWPTLRVHRDLTTGKPSYKDPMGSGARLRFYHDQITNGAMFELDGVFTPLLEPAALQTYLLLEWPQYFTVNEHE